MDDRERRKSLVDRANDAYSAYQNARGLYQLGRGAMAAARSAQAAISGIGALGAAGWPIIVVLFLIVVPTFLIVMGGEGTATEIPESSTPVSGSSQTNLNPVRYCQYDGQWNNLSCNIAKYGCVPTAVAMLLSSFGDHEWTPLTVSAANGNIGCRAGADAPLSWIESLGYEVVGQSIAFQTNFNINQAKTYIDEGYLLLGLANVTFRSSSGGGLHAFIITGVDPESEELTVLDPTYCTSDDDFARRFLNINDVLCNADGCGWYSVRAIKKL